MSFCGSTGEGRRQTEVEKILRTERGHRERRLPTAADKRHFGQVKERQTPVDHRPQEWILSGR
jgi:hypothetical protein